MTRSIRTSLTLGEIQVLDYVTTALLRGSDCTVVTRHKEFVSLCRKVKAMKATAVEQAEENDDTDAD